MKDVKKYGTSAADDECCNINGSFNENGVKESRKREKEVKKKQNLPLKGKVPLKENVSSTAGKINVSRREGLFQRGIITKDFNKGLMPPSLSARLNEDLKKMINLATKKRNSSTKSSEKLKKYSRAEEDIWKKITSLNDKHHDSCSDYEESIYSGRVDEDCENSGEINNESNRLHENPQKVEVEVQVSDPVQTNSSTRDDLYLKFTHFITGSLFNSGINKEDVRPCNQVSTSSPDVHVKTGTIVADHTEFLKESLIEIYHSRLKGKDVQKESPCPELNSDIPSLQQEDSDMLEGPSPFPVLPEKNAVLCPSMSRSEDGPNKERFVFTNDSQLSDDIVIRKPKKLYTSGIEYLQAVYGKNDKENRYKSTNYNTSCTFSPIQDSCDNTPHRSFASLKNNSYCTFSPERNFNYFDVVNNNKKFNSFDKCENSKQLESSRSLMDCDDELKSSSEFGDPLTLQYFPGRNKPNHSCNEGHYYPCNSNFNARREICVQSSIYKSPECISLLPASHKLTSSFVQSFYSAQPASKGPYDGSGDGDCYQLHQSILSLPKHPPPRKSPKIHYIPRRMF